MSEASNGDTGSKDRTTVALVGAKVDEVKAIIAGHAETTNAKLDALSQRIDDVAGLPVKVADHEARLKNLEDDASFRRGPLIASAIALAALAVSIAGVLITAL